MAVIVIVTKGTSGIPNFGGSTWVRLQYYLGFRAMGHETYWIDRLMSVDPVKSMRTIEYRIERFAAMARRFGFENQYCVDYNQGERFYGMTMNQYKRVTAKADLLVSVSGGALPPESLLCNIPVRVYIDVDPGFTQIWAQKFGMGIDQHNLFFTVGQNVGRSRFKIPTRGVEWIPILPPVYLEEWPMRFEERCINFTTIGDWRGSQSAQFNGEKYAGKRAEFQRLIDLPLRVNQSLELALCIGQHDYADLGLLTEKGWHVVSPYWYAGDPLSYREYIQYSRAEFSVAKSGYVKSESGWVSDRTACYLASGKPALVQSTGFEDTLPCGRGLLTFSTLEDAIAGIEEINSAYSIHCDAARQIAQEYFDARRVLTTITAAAGI